MPTYKRLPSGVNASDPNTEPMKISPLTDSDAVSTSTMLPLAVNPNGPLPSEKDGDVGSSAVRRNHHGGGVGADAGDGCRFGREGLDDRIGGGVDDMDEAARHVGAGAVRGDRDVPTTASDGNGRHDSLSSRVDDLNGASRGRDIERTTIRRHRKTRRRAADRDGRDDRIRGRVDHRDVERNRG